jgi:hypothetical protein
MAVRTLDKELTKYLTDAHSAFDEPVDAALEMQGVPSG